jgi:uncharacterized protein
LESCTPWAKEYHGTLRKPEVGNSKAANQGYADAEYNLGILYHNGDGVTKDHREAARWYKLAAEKGNTKAQFNLALMYYRGEDLTKDYVQAYMWAGLSATNGSREAAILRDDLEKKMTPAQLREAKRLAQEWKPKP